MKKLTIIDTFGFFFRSFFALPPLKNSQGFPTGLLTGFTNFIYSLQKDYKSDYLLFALDSKKNFREDIYKEYKAHRNTPPDDLKLQLKIAIEWIEKMGFKNISIDGFEADDIIATVANIAKKEKNLEVVIVSSDKDLYQLIDDKVKLFDPVKKSIIDKSYCIKKFGVEPENFIDYQALVGDSADNVPGVKGIGAKSAEALINQFKFIENIYKDLNLVSKLRQKNLLQDGKELAFISKELVTLKKDIFNSCDFNEFKFDENPLIKIIDELREYELNAIISKIDKENSDNNIDETKNIQKNINNFKYSLIDDEKELFKIIDSIPNDSIVAVDSETDGLDVKSINLIGFSFAFNDKEGFYVPIGHNYLGVGKQISLEVAKKAIEKLLSKKIIGHNLKFDFGLFYNIFEFDEVKIEADTMILAWLLAPDSSISLDSLALRFFNHQMVKFSDTVKKGENFSMVELSSACEYASEDALFTYKLYFKLIEFLDEEILKEAREVEFDFINTLIEIESNGIKLNCDLFEKFLEDLKVELNSLTDKIHNLAGGVFNINSTKQLAEILFNRLFLKPIKKTKTGFSTDEKVLNKLKDEHEIIPLLLQYREAYKLKSTYLEPLLKYAKSNENKRIYTTLLQTGTQTGRLSSKNPNLQNIPIRTEVGKKIRDGFIADEGKILIGIDYSQIELRLLAHFSGDEALIDAFNNDKDIHLETAIKIFGESEAKNKRAIAKSINFGLIYGMGSKKLSDTLNALGYEINSKEAKIYIESYFESFPTVKNYLEDLKDKIELDGYVETLLKRRRYFDFKSVADYQKQAFLREGVNTLFQGSASDLIKLSMNKIHKLIQQECKNTKMLLQIHDELLFETPIDGSKIVANRFKNIMENIYKLNIPLKTSMEIANSWGELK